MDRANTTRIWPRSALVRTACPPGFRCVAHSILALALVDRTIVPSTVASGVAGMNVELTVTRTQLPAVHAPVTVAPAMSTHV